MEPLIIKEMDQSPRMRWVAAFPTESCCSSREAGRDGVFMRLPFRRNGYSEQQYQRARHDRVLQSGNNPDVTMRSGVVVGLRNINLCCSRAFHLMAHE